MNENTPPPPVRSGEILDHDGASHLVLSRTYRGAPEDVWAAVTEPERLSRWFGDWRGDPATGVVEVAMTAEEYGGEEAPYVEWFIEACEPPHLVRVRSPAPGDTGPAWVITLRIEGLDGDVDVASDATRLDLAQEWHDQWDAGEIGPGWEFYLDRLVAELTGADPAAVTFEPYLALAESYRTTPRRPAAPDPQEEP